MLTAENAHENDINVLSWNNKEPFIASGKYFIISITIEIVMGITSINWIILNTSTNNFFIYYITI